MRTINIDLSQDETHPQKIFGGYAKEHNETELVVTLPTRIISEDIAYYYFEFQTIYRTHLASPNIPKNELTNNTVKLTLWEQLMPQAGDLIFCVTAVQKDADGAISFLYFTNIKQPERRRRGIKPRSHKRGITNNGRRFGKRRSKYRN